MSIDGLGSGYGFDIQVKPQKPQEPTPPAGGNVENRQPPAEPTPPMQKNSEYAKESGVGAALDISA